MGMPSQKEYVKEAYKVAVKIMDIVIDSSKGTPETAEVAVRMLVFGQAGLAAASRMNIQRLTEVGLIPDDLGKTLLQAQEQVSIDLHKAIRAASIMLEADMKDAKDVDMSNAPSKALH